MKFSDGRPDAATVEKVYDNLDFIRGVDVFLNAMSAASLRANIEGLKSVGCDNNTAVIHEDRVDAKTLLLTPNTQTATLWSFMNLKDGPLVVEIPPGVLGLADVIFICGGLCACAAAAKIIVPTMARATKIGMLQFERAILRAGNH